MFDPLSKVVSPVWACKWKPAFLMDRTIRHLFFHFIQSSGVYINYITAWFIYLQRISLEAEKITVFAGCVCSRMNRTNVNNVWIVIKIVVWFLKESYFEWVKMALLCNWFHEIRTPPANHSISTDLGLCMLQPRRDFRTAPYFIMHTILRWRKRWQKQ